MELKPYWQVKDDLLIEESLVLFGARIIVPQVASKGRRKCFSRLHDPHKSIVRAKRRA